jgi:hypothetical protein
MNTINPTFLKLIGPVYSIHNISIRTTVFHSTTKTLISVYQLNTILVFLALFLGTALISPVFSENRLNQYDKSGEKDGVWIALSENNHIIKIEDYSSGVPDGLFSTFSETGGSLSDTMYEFGIKLKDFSKFRNNDVVKEFDLNGELKNGYFDEDFFGSIYPLLVNYYEGLKHGVESYYDEVSNTRRFNIYIQGTLFYIISWDAKSKPRWYYSVWDMDRQYQVNKCIYSKNTLCIEIANNSSFHCLVPSLKSRTLDYEWTRGFLFHELYYVVTDTLFVNLNHMRDTSHPIMDFAKNGFARPLRKRINMMFGNYMEKRIPPNSISTQKINMYRFRRNVRWIVLTIEDKRYLFRNLDFRQIEPVVIQSDPTKTE